jgi:hypothetical protein
VVFVAIISYARNFFVPPSVYGIADTSPVRSLTDALSAVSEGRDKLVFVNSGFDSGDIQKVIEEVSAPARADGDTVITLTSEDELRETCRTTLRGTSSCIAAAVFYSSPNEGSGGMWNYSIRADGSLGSKINTRKSNNDQEIYLVPFQHAIDWAIAGVNAPAGEGSLPNKVPTELPW